MQIYKNIFIYPSSGVVHTFVSSFVRFYSFVQSFVRSFSRSYVRSIICWFVRLTIRHIHTYIHLYIYVLAETKWQKQLTHIHINTHRQIDSCVCARYLYYLAPTKSTYNLDRWFELLFALNISSTSSRNLKNAKKQAWNHMPMVLYMDA